ncbi:MAG: tetratricopeptide repeat protein [Phycisphaerae bacterium]|nr:tetratricopeptide repeat protein [Phycisphaerae bacterium]
MEPEDIDSVLERANRLLEAGQPEDSLQCLARVEPELLDADERTEWASLRAWALTELGRDEEAVEMLIGLLEELPYSSRLLSTLGVVFSNNDELEDARDALDEALSLNPADEVAVANLALVYEKLREYQLALDLYERALSMGADIDWVLQRKAAVLSEEGRYAEAKATLKRYLSLVPEDADQWIALGILYSDDEQYAESFTCYEQAERLDPAAAALRLNWGVTAVRAREMQVAHAQLAFLQQLEPHSTRWWLLRAFILEEEGDLAGAEGLYDRILKQARFSDRSEMYYALEMAMDFFARHKLHSRCSRLLKRAYASNACTVELCEAYREAAGQYVEQAFWFSLMIEADYRAGLSEVYDGEEQPLQGFTRFRRVFQVVARNHDEAVGLVLEFARRMGESNPAVREFVGHEPIEDIHTGIYEVETDSFVFAHDSAE